MENFILSKTNPNDSTGGKGCLCSARETADCKPPFVVFQGQETMDRFSPFAVACQNCLKQAVKGMEELDELQTVGHIEDSRPNLGTVSPEALDEVRKIMDENWLPEPGEDYVPKDLGKNLKVPEETVAETMTPEEYAAAREAEKPAPTHTDGTRDEVPSL